MKIKLLFMSMLLVLGAIQLNAQAEPAGDDRSIDDRPCVSFAQVVQECEEDGTVTITFLISNNSRCSSSGVTITDDKGFGQSYPINTNGQTVSNVSITYSGATPGSLLCFDVILHGRDGRECCRAKVCIRVECCDQPGCCELEAELISTGGCDPNAWARVMVTGGTAPYSGPPNSFQAGIAGNFIIQELSGGPHVLTFTDSEGCEVSITVVIPESDLEASFEATGGCDPTNRWARVMVTGGAAPYTGPPNSFQAGTTGNFIIQGLSIGVHVLTFTDSNGCEVEVTVIIPAGSCDQFDNINLTQSSPPLPPITSEVSATVGISIVGWCIPDKVEVLINGVEVLELIAGSGGCTGLSTNTGASGTFCVEPCDVVEIVTTGNVCPGEFDCPGSTSTAFDVYTHSCTLKNGGGGSLKASDHLAERIKTNKEFALNYEAMRGNALQAVKVYPNPVVNELYVANTDPSVDYQSVRLINSAGQVLHVVNMSNLDQVTIDASTLPKGVYIVELITANGNRFVEKIMKMD